jgi:hypothetical protein
LCGVAMICFMTSDDAFRREAAFSPANITPADNTPTPTQAIPNLLNLCSVINLSLVVDSKPV